MWIYIFNILPICVTFLISNVFATMDFMQLIETNATDYLPTYEGILTISDYQLSNLFINYNEVYEFAMQSIDSKEERNIKDNTTTFKNYYNSLLQYFLNVNANTMKLSNAITFSNWDWLIHGRKFTSVMPCQTVVAWLDIREVSRATNLVYLIVYSKYSKEKKCEFNIERVKGLHKKIEATLYNIEDKYRVSWCQNVQDNSIDNINIRVMKWVYGMRYAQNIWNIPCEETVLK